MTAARPRIGITTDDSYSISEYERAVADAGGEPVRITPQSGAGATALNELDGIVFAGGDDIDPARYGQTPDPHTEPPSAERDAFELDLMRTAFARRLPTLAICRGVQVANVAFGGTLHQHVPDTFGAAIAHQPQVDGKTYRGIVGGHRVEAEPASLLASLAGAVVETGSRHHQSLDRIGEPFHVVARTPDGVVEALEANAPLPFWLGVQWHPESTVALDGGASAALFDGLVAAAREHSAL